MMTPFKRAASGWFFLFILLLTAFPIEIGLGQELSPVATYIYYGQQMSLEEINRIASARWNKTGAYTNTFANFAASL
jgi:hypothetical protein